MSDFQLPDDERLALIGFHAATGNDYTSAFFGKGKTKCWKVMKSKEKFVIAFQQLGDDWQLSEALLNTLEIFTCKLYGSRKSIVNKERYELIDLSLLPPCKTTLNLHLQRCNYVARIWKCSGSAENNYPLPSEHGWNADFDIKWCEDIFPSEIEDLLIENFEENDENDDDEVGTDEESSDSDNEI